MAPNHDWIDYAALTFDAVASLGGVVALFIAIKAYRTAKAATSITFELEVLREMSAILRGIYDQGRIADDLDADSLQVCAFWAAQIGAQAKEHLVVLSDRKMKLWCALAQGNFADLNGLVAAEPDSLIFFSPGQQAYNKIATGLQREVLEAIKRRMS